MVFEIYKRTNRRTNTDMVITIVRPSTRDIVNIVKLQLECCTQPTVVREAENDLDARGSWNYAVHASPSSSLSAWNNTLRSVLLLCHNKLTHVTRMNATVLCNLSHLTNLDQLIHIQYTNAQGSSMTRWKAHCGLPISDNSTFLASSHGCDTIKRNLSKSEFSEGWVTLRANFR